MNPESLFNSHKNLAKTIASKWLTKGAIRGMMYEDLVQECYMAMIDKIIPAYNPDKAKFSTFCYRALNNYLNNKFYKNVPILEGLPKVQGHDEDLDYEIPCPKEYQPFDKILASQLFRNKELTDLEKYCIIGYCNGRTNPSMAEELGVTYQAVDAAKKRGFKKMGETDDNWRSDEK